MSTDPWGMEPLFVLSLFRPDLKRDSDQFKEGLNFYRNEKGPTTLLYYSVGLTLVIQY